MPIIMMGLPWLSPEIAGGLLGILQGRELQNEQETACFEGLQPLTELGSNFQGQFGSTLSRKCQKHDTPADALKKHDDPADPLTDHLTDQIWNFF